ncbi:hypothetical protein [Streptomyces sp. NPDC003832]
MPEQRPRGSAGRAMSPRHLMVTGLLALVPLVTGCGGGEADAPRAAKVTAAPTAGVVAPAKVEVIAGLTGCEAEIRIDADELRQGVCRTERADFLITTFPEERLKETWLESAGVYGGTYLVGTRWVVGAEPEHLGPLREKLGGTVRELRGIGAAPES